MGKSPKAFALIKSGIICCGTLLAPLTTARACDLCGCYTPQIEAMPQPADPSAFGGGATMVRQDKGWLARTYFAIAEQFTHFGTLQLDGDEVDNPTGQHLDSSITQAVAGYSFTSHFALQLNIPFIYRSFARPEGFTIDRGTESGLGDISLLGRLVVLHKETGGTATLKFEIRRIRTSKLVSPISPFRPCCLAV